MNDICQLKDSFWSYGMISQKSWLDTNVKDGDINCLIYLGDKLISYGLLMIRNVGIIDSIIVDKDYRGMGIGKLLINCLKQQYQRGLFLLCESSNIKFYEKCGFEYNSSVVVNGKQVGSNLNKMIYKLDSGVLSVKY